MGFDINCGVRLVRTNLTLEDVLPVKEELTQSLFDHIPVGVGTKGVVPIKAADLNDVLVRDRGGCLSVCLPAVVIALLRRGRMWAWRAPLVVDSSSSSW